MSSPSPRSPESATPSPARSFVPLTARPSASPAGSAPGVDDYLKKILTARVYDVAVETALEPARNPVSYTHLDVYKRQGRAIAARRRESRQEQPVGRVRGLFVIRIAERGQEPVERLSLIHI